MGNASKAWLGALVTALTAVIGQVADKSQFSDLTPLQWMLVVLSGVVAFGTVYVVPNTPKVQ